MMENGNSVAGTVTLQLSLLYVSLKDSVHQGNPIPLASTHKT